MDTKKFLAVAALLCSGVAQAALVDRGGGMMYDDVLNVTWLKDANYSKTSNYDTDGRMDWASASAWAANLVYGGYSDWRLPTARPLNGATWNFPAAPTADGSSDYGWNIVGTNNELAYMFHVNLGLKGFYSTAGVPIADWGLFGNATTNGINQASYGENDIGLAINIQALNYWTDVETYQASALSFNFADGGVSPGYLKDQGLFGAWAVRDGDVATVHEPASVALLGLSLLVLLATRRFTLS